MIASSPAHLLADATPSGALSHAAGAASASTTVPFRLAGGEQPLLLVPVEIDGRGPFDFVLDTGAGTCVATPALARRLGLPTLDRKPARGARGEPVEVELSRLGRLAIGGVEAHDVDVLVTAEMDRIAAAIGAPVDGALGFNVLGTRVVRIDYAASTLRLSGSDDSAPEARLPLRLASPRKPLILVDASLDGRELQLAVDTGASTTVLDVATAAALGLHTSAIPPITGMGGGLASSAAQLRELRLGPAVRRDLPVGVVPLAGLAAALGIELHGIVGHNFLRHFLVTIDYPAATLALEPPAAMR